uniref:Reverse transcriptase domain-containing protein n=1 Tax=Tanacetum cinerariifolium TaxID=118510 RepID=A0A6L2MT56_TANCI|nr:hypothetical protein [Tanacetum cinerariifolium]
MEEMLYKFIDEGRQEHEEMGAYIRDFKTTNELLLKERNNSLSELKFKVYGLLKAINNAQLSNCEVKDMREDYRIPIVLGRPFLATARAMMDVFNKKITLRVGNEEELLEDDQLDSLLVNNLEGCNGQSDLEICGKGVGDSESEISKRRIK